MSSSTGDVFWKSAWHEKTWTSKVTDLWTLEVMPAVKVVNSLDFHWLHWSTNQIDSDYYILLVKYTISQCHCLSIVLIVSLSYFAGSVESLVTFTPWLASIGRFGEPVIVLNCSFWVRPCLNNWPQVLNWLNITTIKNCHNRNVRNYSTQLN